MRPTKVTTSPRLRQGALLRRYMDLAKLLDLLQSQTLYLRRADGFSDRLEGALFPTFRKQIDAAHKRGEVAYDAEYFYRRARQGTYVSCWTVGPHDNMALWQLYGGTQTSIAVTTTVERLLRLCLSWKRSAIVWKVDYVDHRKKKSYVIGQYTDVLQYKNTAYAYEDELRVLVPAQDDGWEENPMGLRLAIPDKNLFVRSIVVAPDASTEFKSAVEDLCRKYGLTAPIRESALAVTRP